MYFPWGLNYIPQGEIVFPALPEPGAVVEGGYERKGRPASGTHKTELLKSGVVRLVVQGRPVSLVCPSDQQLDYSLERVTPAPAQRLKLEWVYGYRGREGRANLHLLPTGEMVYPLAALVVLYNTEEHSQRHYLGHTEDVRCMALHPNRLTLATGQVHLKQNSFCLTFLVF